MPNGKRGEGGLTERLKILEKALASLADGQKKRNSGVDEELADILRDLKAIKVFLSRNAPGFRSQFPEIQRKIR